MEGADSKAADVDRFPPFVGWAEPFTSVRYSYVLGRETKKRSDGWVPLQCIDGMVGPEIGFARTVTKSIDAPIAIIKCAAGGTHLGGDWNPDNPAGFEMYPLLLQVVKESLQALEMQGIEYRLEGFMWHQGENDMFEPGYMQNYGANLRNFLACLRRDLNAPALPCYVGELCTKTIWGMDLRPRMNAIYQGQRFVTDSDPLATYVPTSHVGVEIGGGVGLHYHYGTLGQLEHGVNYAHAYLRDQGVEIERDRSLTNWPYSPERPLRLFVLAGHRNMEGERAFVGDLKNLTGGQQLTRDDATIAYRYRQGRGYQTSSGWEALGPAGYYETFGPELSFAARMKASGAKDFAVAKFTDSGSQIIDWTPRGSDVEARHVYPAFMQFIRESIAGLEAQGHDVELAGVFYHVGENDMSFYPYRQEAASRLKQLIEQSRQDLSLPELPWFISQQVPTKHDSVDTIDVVSEVRAALADDPHSRHLVADTLPPQREALVLDAAGVVALGQLLADSYLDQQ